LAVILWEFTEFGENPKTKEQKMKKKALLFGLIGMMLVLALALTGCPDPNTNDTPTPTTATITINNSSGEYKITRVTVLDAATNNNEVLNEKVDIGIKGGSKSFTVDPGKFIVKVTDEANDTLTSTQFTLAAGGTKSLTYTGLELY
jgi:hypothetical protein